MGSRGPRSSRKPGDCVCECHKSGMTGALGPCRWCAELHRPKAALIDGSLTPAQAAELDSGGMDHIR